MAALAEAAAEADFLLVTLPLDAQTRGVIDARVLGAMKPTGVILNVGRGPTIDEEALYLALRDRRIGGAIIDTWYDYPPQAGAATAVHAPSRFPFRELDNILMSPHASAWTEALAARRCAVIADNLDRLARGEPLRNVVAPARAGTAAPKPQRISA
jgi:phosphoglycerate dehydrogenase-like enzyme